mmetsp:Transcript_20648/g.31871  ORF Transcript_20648/g.31871 Transcript_20648/m.31871 type:complete len:233 (-) Transcript_20648:96-794(-)
MNNNQSPPQSQSSSPMQQHSANMQQQQPRHYLSRTVSNTSTSSSSSQQTTTTAPNKRQRLRNRSVHFAPISNLFIVPTKSPQDIHASYYNEQDTVNFKREMSYSSQVMSSCPVVDVVEDIAYGLATESLDVMMIQARIRQLHPQERILTRGIEHVVSSTVLKLMAHRRKVVVRRVVNEQARLRQLQQQQQQVGGRWRDAAEAEWRMSMALAQFSMENTVFAKEWAVLKLLDD